MLASSDGGRTWSHRLLPGSGPIAFTTPAQGWLAPADGGLYRTRDGGGTWRPVALPTPAGLGSTPPLADPPTFGEATQAVLPVTFRRGSRTDLSFLASPDGGKTWRSAATVAGGRAPAPADRVPAAIVDSTHWLALPDGGRRVVSLANGKPVRAVATAGLPLTAPGFQLEDVSFASATTGWATVSTCAAGSGARCPRAEALYRTVDGGVNWSPLSLPG
jgi:photosystem II stability/assembly factor-like uncharacterized protein